LVRRGKTVLTTGVFDILHPGHIHLLRYASRLKGRGGRLVVVVARDETVKKRKGRQPVFGERERLLLVRSLRFVDEAYLGYMPFSFKRVMERFHPDVVVFGYDQDVIQAEFREAMAREGWRVRIVRAPKMSSTQLNSSTSVLAKISRLIERGILTLQTRGGDRRRFSRGLSTRRRAQAS